MTAYNDMLVLSRIEIEPGATCMVTNRTDVNVTLWIEHGPVVLQAMEKVHLCGGPIPIDRGPVIIANLGKTNALVFAAITESSQPVRGDRSAPVAFKAVKSLAHDDLDSIREGTFSVFCPQEPENERALAVGQSASRAQRIARDHNDANSGHHATSFPE